MAKKEKISSIRKDIALGNLDKVKAWLANAFPDEKEKIMSSDAARVVNCWMQNDKNKEMVASGLGFENGKCDMCIKDGGCANGVMLAYGCRRGILRWLES